MGNFSSVLNKILIAREVYLRNSGNPPGYVDITIEMETDLATAGFQEIGVQVTNLILYGPRTAFKNLLGMSVTWDAKEFKVYGDEHSHTQTEEVKLDL